MDMMKIEFRSLLLSAKAVKINIERLSQQHSVGENYTIVTKRSVELLIEEMEEFEEKYIEVDNDKSD